MGVLIPDRRVKLHFRTKETSEQFQTAIVFFCNTNETEFLYSQGNKIFSLKIADEV